MGSELEGGSSSHQQQACASCKHQRKKCNDRCELAPYFPASRFREFQNAHKLFGVSNIQKIMNLVEPHQRQAAAESILMEGNLRCTDPVHGCLGVVRNLKSQILHFEEELAAVNQQLASFRERERRQQEFKNFLLKGASSSSVFDAAAFSPQPQTLTDIGDMVKIGRRMYDHESTVEEHMDRIMVSHQNGNALASQLDQSRNSK